MILSTIIIVVLILIILVLVFIIRNQVIRNDAYENWISSFSDIIIAIDDELDRLDSVGTFRSDDEIGFFFQAIYSILKRLSDYKLVNLEELEEERLIENGEELPVNPKEAEKFYSLRKEIVKRRERVRQNIEIEDVKTSGK